MIEPKIILAAILCRRAYLLDGKHWSGSHQTGWGSVYDDPEAGEIGWSATELIGRSLDRTERRQATAALHSLAADGLICLIQSGKRTVALRILVDVEIDDEERAAFDAWRIAFSDGAIEASEAKHEAKQAARDAERQQRAAAQDEIHREQAKAYQEERRGNRRRHHT